jgi:hypothetical protein
MTVHAYVRFGKLVGVAWVPVLYVTVAIDAIYNVYVGCRQL